MKNRRKAIGAAMGKKTMKKESTLFSRVGQILEGLKGDTGPGAASRRSAHKMYKAGGEARRLAVAAEKARREREEAFARVKQSIEDYKGSQ